MNPTSTHYHTLPNGLSMVHITTQGDVAWCGLAVNAGSRDELPGQFGLAHFVEHTIFKGTAHRRAWHILNRMERVGGELNAYTTKEGTMLYSVFPAQHLARAVELLADLVMWSVFPDDELRRELDVVLEEAAGYRDTPAEAVYDDFEDLLMAGSQLGHNILGRPDHLRQLTRDDCMHYLKTLYVPENMVFFSVGPQPPHRVFRLAERYFAPMHHPKPVWRRMTPPSVPAFSQRTDIGNHQSHTVAGCRLPGMHHDQRFALMLLNNIMGGPGMNSLLNVELRERRGYVYSVESSVTLLSDCGFLEIYLGCDQSDVKSSLAAIGRIITRLAETPLAERRLQACKQQYCGQLTVAANSTEYLAMRAGKSMLYHGRVSDIAAVKQRIMDVTPVELRQAAQLIAAQGISSLTFD